MPTVLRSGPYRFFFFSNEGSEPVHIHVESGDSYAKFWLKPLRLAASAGYSAPELNRLHRLIATKSTVLSEAWRDHFGR
jgi:hypothetical protein